jgi:hypothetical protein
MALVQNNTTRYLSAQADYDSVVTNEYYTPPGVTVRNVRGYKASNGGDVSQIGSKRLMLDKRLQLVVAEGNRAYFQPKEFDLGLPDVICARVTCNLPALRSWSANDIDSVQKTLIPKDDLTPMEIERIVDVKMDEIADEIKAYRSVVAAFVNNNCEGNNALKGVMLSAVGEEASVTARTTAAGLTGEQVTALRADHIADMGIGDLTTIAEQIKSENLAMSTAISTLLGAAYYALSPKMAASFEPFSSAVEMARVARESEVDADVVELAINYDGIIAEAVAKKTIVDMVIVQVVYAKNLHCGLLAELTDQDFLDEELDALTAYRRDPDVVGSPALASALVKLGNAKAADGSDWIAAANSGDDDAAELDMYNGVGDWESLAIDELDYLGALGKYALAAPTTRVLKTKSASATALADFATTRMNTINHQLTGASAEIISHKGLVWGALSLAMSVALFDAVSDDIVGQLQHCTAHISFMKSGHHASANNVGHTLVKLTEAIDQHLDAADLPERLAYGTYYGTKPADQRAVALFLRTKYSRNDLSFAVGRRITPNGPGTVAMFLLNMVMDQLDHINFFEFLDRKDQYTHFKGVFNQYKRTAFREVPYAEFFYGRGKAESVEMKQSVAPMYAYASAIGLAMPHSTIGDSVALRREATASASNSITARLEVESFVRAYRTFLRGMIRKKLEIRAGIKGGTALLEDGLD